jgi:hypothetical protein
MHGEIFSLCYHGKGGFTWEEVYNLPIYLRRFYIQQINKTIEAQNKAESQASKTSAKSAPTFSKPRR